VYVPNAGGQNVLSCSTTAATCGSGTVVMSSVGKPTTVYSDGTNVWAGGTSSPLYTCPVGSTCSSPAPFASVPAYNVVSDGTNVYWTTGSGNILRCPVSGCGTAPTTIYTGTDNPTALTQDATSLYYISGTGMYRLSK
jgi:hypothetical protein